VKGIATPYNDVDRLNHRVEIKTESNQVSKIPKNNSILFRIKQSIAEPSVNQHLPASMMMNMQQAGRWLNWLLQIRIYMLFSKIKAYVLVV